MPRTDEELGYKADSQNKDSGWSMEWEWYMTPGECADYWRDLLQRKTYDLLNNVDANTTMGFMICWGVDSLEGSVDMFLIDNLRLGRGLGEATTTDSWLQAGLGVISDVSRATAFIPLGKLVKSVPKAPPIPGRSIPAPVRPPVPASAKAGKVPAPITAPSASKTQSVVADLYRRMFYFSDPASDKGICSFVSLVQACRHSGRILMKIEDVAKLVGVEMKKGVDFFKALEKQAPNTTMQVWEWLQKLSVPSGYLSSIRSVEELLAFAAQSKQNGVYIFAVKWWLQSTNRAGQDILKNVGHLMYVGRTASGEVRIFDRSGRAVRSLEELEKLAGYPGIGRAGWRFEESCCPIFIPNAKLIETTSNGIKVAGVTFGGALSIAIPVRVLSFMTGNSNGRK